MAKRLGKGLNALIPEFDSDEQSVQQIDINACRPNPYQPRKTFDADSIEELKQSILEYGIIQPLIVRKSIKGYEIVAGERRYRAAKEAGLKEVPAIVTDYDDEKMMEIALLENLQREDLTVIEEAMAYKKLIETLNITQDELSKKIGKSRSHIANTMRLLTLPQEVIRLMNNGEISMGHGRALLGLKRKTDMKELARRIVKDQLNVRQVEQLVNELNNKPKKKVKKEQGTNPFIAQYEAQLREALGTNVRIHQGKTKGKIEIDFYSEEDLEQFIEMLR